MEIQENALETSGANLVLFDNGHVTQIRLDGKLQMRLGRALETHIPDIAADCKLVSPQQGIFANLNGLWYYTDVEEVRYPTLHNGHRMDYTGDPVLLSHGDILRISPTSEEETGDQGLRILFLSFPIDGRWTEYQPGKHSCLIGRDQQLCQISEAKPYYSSEHAEVYWQEDSYYIRDLDSMAGTFLNGSLLKKEQMLEEHDCFSICGKPYFFADGRILYAATEQTAAQKYPSGIPAAGSTQPNTESMKNQMQNAPVLLQADILSRREKIGKGRQYRDLLRNIHLTLRKGTLTALVGAEDSGAEILFSCLKGMETQDVEGRIYLNHVDLLKNFKQMKYLIGSVPAEHLIHPFLTPEEELEIAATMRLPADFSKKEIRNYVDRTIKMLGMNNVRDTQNRMLTPGEQSCVNFGIELAADREVLFLEDPAADLTPAQEHELLVILRDVAHSHEKTILTISRDVSEPSMYDQVILMAANEGTGQIVFAGTPEEAKLRFGCGLRETIRKIEMNPEKYLRG